MMLFKCCCYCEVELLPSGLEIPIIRKDGSFNLHKANITKHPQSETKEHLFPRRIRVQSVCKNRLTILRCCYACNCEKSHLTLQEFIDKLKTVNANILKESAIPTIKIVNLNLLKIKNAEKLIKQYPL